MEGERATRESGGRPRWAGPTPAREEFPSTILFFLREGLKGRELEAVTVACGRVGDHSGGEEAVEVAAADD